GSRMNLGVLLPKWVGDAVMATPCLRALRRHFGPRARIVGIMRPYVAGVFEGSIHLSEGLLYDPSAKAVELNGWRFWRRLRQQRFDMIVLCTNSLRTGLLAAVSGARERVGYARYGRGSLLTQKLETPREHSRLSRYAMADYYLQLAYAIGCAPEDQRLELTTT